MITAIVNALVIGAYLGIIAGSAFIALVATLVLVYGLFFGIAVCLQEVLRLFR